MGRRERSGLINEGNRGKGKAWVLLDILCPCLLLTPRKAAGGARPCSCLAARGSRRSVPRGLGAAANVTFPIRPRSRHASPRTSHGHPDPGFQLPISNNFVSSSHVLLLISVFGSFEMAAARLPFLYPNLIRSIRSCEPTTYRSLRFPPQGPAPPAGFHTSRRYEQELYPRRYGPAAEPKLPPPSRPKGESASQPAPGSSTGKESSPAWRSDTPQGQSQAQDLKRQTGEASSDSENKAVIDASSTNDTQNRPPEDDLASDLEEGDTAPLERWNEDQQPPARPDQSENPLEDVLQMPSPSASLMPSGVSAADGRKPPHLTPPPYVHHFDTYTLVRDLTKGGFTDGQAITIMKAIRSILADNLEMARRTLTSKSELENEQYLFKAACSELQQSLQVSRNAEIQRQRSSRTQLQHEVDILSQRMNQELMGLKDDLKGMFNDHKMMTREMMRSVDTAIQELNYKITISLNSDGKSEVESLRWILTRRAAMTVATSASRIPSSLRPRS